MLKLFFAVSNLASFHSQQTDVYYYLYQVLNQTQDHRQRVLHNVAKELPNWSIMVRKMKAIYHTMNLFNMDVSKKCLIGECWVPVADLAIVQNCLTEGSVSIGFFLFTLTITFTTVIFIASPSEICFKTKMNVLIHL